MNELQSPLFIEVPTDFDESVSNNIWKHIQERKRIILYNKEIHHSFIKETNLENFQDWPETPFIGLFSSGSTGNFKLILHHHESFERSARGSSKIIKELHQSRFNKEVKTLYTTLPLFHTGGLLSLFRKKLHLFEVQFKKQLQASLLNETTVAIGVPAQLPFLLKECSSPFSFYSGGDAPSPALLERSKEILLISTYGLTESCGAILYKKQTQVLPFPNVEVKLRDDQTLTFRSDRDAFLKMDFKNSWELQKVSREDGFIETTDIAEITKTGIQIKGRKDQIFISGGENIHPQEILKEVENLLSNEDLNFSKIKCLGMPDERLGKVATLFIRTSNIDELERISSFLGTHFKGLHRPRFLCPYPEYSGIKPTLKDFEAEFKKSKREIS